MRKIYFTKMQGLGNDFVIIDGITYPHVNLSKDEIRWLSDRHFGVGFDQLLWILPAQDEQSDFMFRIFNADGSEVEQCGNGARCVARYLYDHQLINKISLRLATKATVVQAEIGKPPQVKVDMGRPLWQGLRSFSLDDQCVTAALINMGNPHAVINVADVESAPVNDWGRKLQNYWHSTQGVNVEFMQILSRRHIRLRVFERGVGETLACGSGACAAVVAGCMQELLDKNVQVDLPGGKLLINWEDSASSIKMTGPAEVVFTGECNLQYA